MPKILNKKTKYDLDENFINKNQKKKNSNRKKNKSTLVSAATNTFNSSKIYCPFFTACPNQLETADPAHNKKKRGKYD